ncbi:MAG: hypothetical protein E7540_00915 [Ruminococcaceae bacterium]|nr:hypothetical protein [Oscillospiraceae bacterium]
MKIKNVLLTGLSFVLVGAVAIGSTLAYLTSEDSDVNVMTLGNVSIEQVEYERDENGNLVEFSQAKPAFPAVYDTEAWAEEGVNVNGDEYKVFSNDMKNVVDKIVTVNNTGKSDAFVRTLIAIEAPEGDPNNLIHINFNSTDVTVTKSFLTDINNITYYVMCCTYNEAIAANEKSAPSLMQVFLDKKATNEDCAKFGDAWEILVMSQAVQTEGFANATTALDTAFGAVDEAKVSEWFGDAEIPVIVNTADELASAIANGGEVIVNKDISDFNTDNAITVAAGKNVTLNLNGHSVSAVANGTGNREAFVVKGSMTVQNGKFELVATKNQGWNYMAAIFDVTAGGVLNMENVTLKVDGTDMTFGVHLNNWGEVTLNMNNCTIDSNYCAVRVFNSGFDMNNVKITNSTLIGNTRAFWVHNYIGDLNSNTHSNDAINNRLNLDIYNNNNTFVLLGTAKSPIRYGFSSSVYYDAAGNIVE